MDGWNNNPTSNDAVKILSYNVRLFDLYNWSKNNYTRLEILGVIKNTNANIMCFQEFYSTKDKRTSNVDTILNFLPKMNYYIQGEKHKLRYKGLAIFTEYPIVKTGVVALERSPQAGIFADILLKNDTIRVYNIHLASNKFGYDTYKFIDTTRTLNLQSINGVVNIYKKLKYGYIARAQQADYVALHIYNSPYPVIVCGDFNDTPVSYTYHRISRRLKDTFREKGFGFGVSYAGKFPPVRIDYILHSPYFRTVDFKTEKVKFSDHYPIIGTINISK